MTYDFRGSTAARRKNMLDIAVAIALACLFLVASIMEWL